MAIHHLTPPIRGGERPRLPSAQVGPVTQAIRAMRRPTWPLHAGDIHALSRADVEDLIGGLIDLLDAMDGDTDHEPDVDLEDGHDAEGDTNDNGIADNEAIGEQGFGGHGGCL